MPTLIPSDILKLTDSHGQEVTNFEWIDPENPRLLISPEIGKTYTCTVYLKNTHPVFRVLHVRLSHSYEDVRIFPEYIDSLKSHKSTPIKIVWKPFTIEGITEKIKNHKVFVEIQNHCIVETVAEVAEEV
jgi:hypothetical protein